MLIFNDGINEGASFFYPLFTGKRSTLKVMPWLRYGRFSQLSFLSSCALLFIGVTLLCINEVPDTLFTGFAGLVLLTGLTKFFLFKADVTVRLVNIKMRRAPLYVSLDFTFYFLALVCMEVIYGKNAPEMVGTLACAVLIFLFFAVVPVLNQVAVRLRKYET